MSHTQLSPQDLPREAAGREPEMQQVRAHYKGAPSHSPTVAHSEPAQQHHDNNARGAVAEACVRSHLSPATNFKE